MRWKIYYADGSTVSSDDSTWDDAPADGIAAVVVRDKDYGSVVLNGLDYYYSMGEEEIHTTNDISAQLRRRCPWLKHGVATPRKKWNEIVTTALKDSDFPTCEQPRRRATDRVAY